MFDTAPLIADLYDEPGAREVADYLRVIQDGTGTGAITHATAAEIGYKVTRLEATAPNSVTSPETVFPSGTRPIHVFQSFGVTIDTPDWNRVARIKAPGGISLGDAYAAALAEQRGATLVVGRDPEFDDIPADIEIERVGE